MTSNSRYFLAILCFTLCGEIKAQQSQSPNITIDFFTWNLENFFDVQNDSLTNDDEFTPQGMYYWTNYRVKRKSAIIWKSLVAVCGTDLPDILFLCEIENEDVLKELFVYSPLARYGYRWIHKDSPDLRGIDVAIVYNPERFKLQNECFIEVDLRKYGGNPTRDIAYGCLISEDDTLHIFGNHWPSKYGGTGLTEPFRREAARILNHSCDTILKKNPDALIIASGDFNDTPESISLGKLLVSEDGGEGSGCMYLIPVKPGSFAGSIKYQGFWELIDHFIVSESIANKKVNFTIEEGQAEIVSPAFMLMNDKVYGGLKPFRTWEGVSYSGGASDHLPLRMRLIKSSD